MISKTEARLQQLLDDWKPDQRFLCRNCLHAKVRGTPEVPVAMCAKGHGEPLLLVYLLRARYPRSFAPASKCADFEAAELPVYDQ